MRAAAQHGHLASGDPRRGPRSTGAFAELLLRAKDWLVEPVDTGGSAELGGVVGLGDAYPPGDAYAPGDAGARGDAAPAAQLPAHTRRQMTDRAEHLEPAAPPDPGSPPPALDGVEALDFDLPGPLPGSEPSPRQATADHGPAGRAPPDPGSADYAAAELEYAPPPLEAWRPARPVVAVVGLTARCGTSTVARWLAAALAARDPDGAAVVSGAGVAGSLVPAGTAAGRLARDLSSWSITPALSVGRLCVVEPSEQAELTVATSRRAPLVLDVGHGAAPTSAAELADHVVLVASPQVEPALAAVVAASIARSGPEPLLVINRCGEPGLWAERPALRIPESRLDAWLARAGRDARAAAGPAIAELADCCEASGWD